MDNHHPLSDAEIASLAPGSLAMYRTSRYQGDGISVTLDDFAEADRTTIRQLYATLQGLLDLFHGHLDQPEAGLTATRAFLDQHDWVQLVRQAQDLGSAAALRTNRELLGQVLHDLRGGALQALSIQLQFASMGLAKPEDLLRLFFLTRDHLKIMRNAVRDVDVAGYEHDRAQKAHNIDLLIEKWQGATYRLHGVAAQLAVDCRFDGTVSERCLEFAALDRVLYNLINNAARNTADGRVALAILPLGQRQPQHLRFVIANSISAKHQRLLQEHYGDELGELFRGGFTTGGTGQGMQICASFVRHAYGIPSFEQALAEGHFGAQLIRSYFVSWFHWPIPA